MGSYMYVVQNKTTQNTLGLAESTQVVETNSTEETGSIKITMKFPFNRNPYIENFEFITEGYLTRISDIKNNVPSYSIFGLVIKGIMNF